MSIQIIHLVRDPRAMVNSMYQRPNRDWHSVNQTKLMCKVLEMDYEIIRTLDPYRLVKTGLAKRSQFIF